MSYGYVTSDKTNSASGGAALCCRSGHRGCRVVQGWGGTPVDHGAWYWYSHYYHVRLPDPLTSSWRMVAAMPPIIYLYMAATMSICHASHHILVHGSYHGQLPHLLWMVYGTVPTHTFGTIKCCMVIAVCYHVCRKSVW